MTFLNLLFNIFFGSKKVKSESLAAPVEVKVNKGIIKVKDDSERLKKELEDLKTANPELRDLLFDLADWIKEQFDKETVITMIGRTAEEQAYLYRNDEKFKKKPFKSPHQLMHAADLRSRTFTVGQIEQIVTWINDNYNKNNYYKWTAKNHDVGAGDHLHIQFVKKA